MRPRAVFFNGDRRTIQTGVQQPALINSDIYWHDASNPVSAARLLGTFKMDRPIPFTLPLANDTDVALRPIGRGPRGLVTEADVSESEPYLLQVQGLGGGAATGESLENEHVPVTPVRAILNAELPFLQFRDEGDTLARSQIRSRRTATGAQNVVTDWNASGDGRIYKVILTAGSKDIQIIPGQWFDSDVTWHPVPYWSEAAVPHSFRGGQGVRILGAGPGGIDLYTTVTAVAGPIVTVADAPSVSANPGAFVHDDTAAVIAAWNNRGHVWLPEGRYWINQRMLWPATSTGLNQQIILEGDGEWRSVLMFNHDGNGIQLVGSAQTGNPDSGVYDAIIRNLGIWCVPDNNKEGIRTTSKGHGIAFTATSSNGGVPGPSTGNVRVENVLLQGWGRWGLWSDNLQSAFLTNIKGYHNRSGSIALVGNATVRGTSQQEDNSIEITNSLIVYNGPNDFGATSDTVRTLSGGSIAGSSRALTVSGGLTQNDVGRIIKLVDGPGVNGTTHVTMIESVQSATQCTISMPVWQAASGFAVIIYQTSVANVFVHNANNVRITGGTHQGNWVNHSGDAAGVRGENLDCLRIDGLWEEDAGGTAGAAIDLYNCRAVNIDSTHTGGSVDVDPPITPAGHSVGIRMTDCQGVKVRGTYLGQSGAGTTYATHGNCQGVEFENCYGADWIAGLSNTDVAGEPVIIGPGCHSLSFDNVQTSTLALWDEQWTNIVGNPNFLEGMVGWTTPVAGVVTQPNYPYTNLPGRWDRYVVINTQALGSGLVDVLTQDIALPDSRQSGQWTFSWDHYIESRGAGGTTDNNTVVTIEVRTATAGYTVRSVTLTADAGYGLPVGRWMRLCIKTNLDGGVTGRFFRIRFSNAGTANSPIFRVANMRLQPGISPTFDFDQPITQERGGPLYAPLYFKALFNPAQFPAPPPPANAISLVNIGGVLNIGQGGVYAPISTTSGLTGRQSYLPKFAITGGGAATSLSDSSSLSENATTLYEVGHDFALDVGKKIYLGGVATPQSQAMYWDNSGTPPRLFIGTPSGTAEIIEFMTGAQTPAGTGRFYIDGNWSRLTWNAPVATVNSSADGAAFYLATQDTDNGMWVKMPAASDGDPFVGFVGSNRVFAVSYLGDLTIHSVPYQWPSSVPATDATHPVKVLGYTNAAGPTALAWLDPPGGTSSGVVISGTAGTVAMFNAAGNNVTNSGLQDNGTEIIVDGVNSRNALRSNVANTLKLGTAPYPLNQAWFRGTLGFPVINFDPAGTNASNSLGINVTSSFTPGSTNENFYFNLYGDRNTILVGDTYRMEIASYYSIEFRGSRQSLTRPAFVTGTATDASVAIICERNVDILRLRHASAGATGNYLMFYDSAAVVLGYFDSRVNAYLNSATFEGSLGESGSVFARSLVLGAGSGYTALTPPSGYARSQAVLDFAQCYVSSGPVPPGVTGMARLFYYKLNPSGVNSVPGLAVVFDTATPIKLIPAGTGGSQGDTFLWDVTKGAWVVGATTGGGISGTGTVNRLPRVATLSGANIATLQDSAIQDDGTNITIFRRLIGSPNGIINIGDDANGRIGGVYVINGFFADPTGTSRSSPKTFGISNFPIATPNGDESGQFLFYCNKNGLQTGNAIKTILWSYYGLELRGNRELNSGPPSGTYPSGSFNDPVVLILADGASAQSSTALLRLDTNQTYSNMLIDAYTSGVQKMYVTAAGAGYFLNGLSTPQSVVSGTGGNTTSINPGTGVQIATAAGASAWFQSSELRLQTTDLADRFVLKPGHVGASTGVIFAEVNGSAAGANLIPFGKGSADNQVFLWSVGFAKWIVGAIPGGTGGGITGTGTMTANYLPRWVTPGAAGTVQDSGFEDQWNGSTNNNMICHRGFLLGHQDGYTNIGTNTNWIATVFCRAFQMNPVLGTSGSSPASAGWIDIPAGKFVRWWMNGPAGAGLQTGNNQRLQIYSYHCIELRGTQNGLGPPSFYNVPAYPDSAGVAIFQDNDAIVPLWIIRTVPSASNFDLIRIWGNGSQRLALRDNGDLHIGGSLFSNGALAMGFEQVIPSAGSFNFSSYINTHSLLIDTINGPCTLQLPAIGTVRHGQSWHILLRRRAASNTVTVAVTDGLINDEATTITMNPGLSGQRDYAMTADVINRIWWLSPSPA
jgi:hypothetical protein